MSDQLNCRSFHRWLNLRTHFAFQVHLSPLKSPPRKVRVGDRDQRVWNDDDDLAPEDVLAFVDDDDFDDDYEPPTNVANSSTLGRHRRHQVHIM